MSNMASTALHSFVSASGKTIRIHAIEPEQSPSAAPLPAVLLLHGSGGNVNFWLDRLAPAIARLGLAVYAVHYFDSTGTAFAGPATLNDGVSVPTWLQTIRETLAWIAHRPAVNPARIGLCGLSLGAFLALALGTEPANRIRAIVDLAGGLVPPWSANVTSAFPPTLILHGDADQVVPVTQAHTLDTLLTAANIPHQIHIFPREGHWLSLGALAQTLPMLGAFLARYL